jgi:hypothetical protein
MNRRFAWRQVEVHLLLRLSATKASPALQPINLTQNAAGREQFAMRLVPPVAA